MASGNSKEVLFMPCSLILIILGWSLYLFIILETIDLCKFGFSGLVQVQKFSLPYLYGDY